MTGAPTDGRTFGPAEFVETSGLVIEQLGLPRMAGRLLGRLLICEPPEQTAAQLATALAASAGSISGTTRLLLGFGLIEKVTLPGDRRDYFRIKPGVWWDLTRQRLLIVEQMKSLLDRGLEFSTEPSVRTRLEDSRGFYDFLSNFFTDALIRWEVHQNAGDRP